MTLPLRPMLTLAATFTLVVSLASSWGFFSTPAICGALAALVLSGIACQLSDRKNVPVRFRSGTQISLDLLFPLFCVCAITIFPVAFMTTELMYADGRTIGWPLAWYGMAALVGLLLCLRADWNEERTSWGYPLLLLSIFILVLASRADVLLRSPNPVIDVYAWLRDSADHLLAAENPYTHAIDSPYGTLRAAKFNVIEPADPKPPAYPPAPILLSAVPRLLKLDVRWANIVGELLGASAIAGVGWRRGRPWLGLGVATLFLNLPRSLWIIEQAWYEPMLAGLFGLGFWLSEFDGWRRWAGGILLGFALTAKQFGLPLFFPVAGSLRSHWRYLLIGLAAAGLVMLPFLVASPNDFFDIVVRKHLGRPPQYHSLTIGSAFMQWFGVTLPRWLTWGLAGAVILSVSWRRAETAAAAALPTGTALLAFSICHTQGYPNYFYLCNYFWLLGFMAMVSPNHGAAAAPSKDGL